MVCGVVHQRIITEKDKECICFNFLMIVNLIHQLIRLYKVEKIISLTYFVANLGSKPTNNETAYSHITIKDWIKSFPFEFIYA